MTVNENEDEIVKAEELEDIEDVKAYDEAKATDDGKRVTLEEYVEKRNIDIPSKQKLEITAADGVKLIKGGTDSLVKFKSQEDLLQFAQLMIDQGLVPSNIKKPGQVISVIQFGAELNVGIMTALGNIHNIQGRPTLSVHLIASRLRERNFRYRIEKDYVQEKVGEKDNKPIVTRVTKIVFTEYFKVGNQIEKLETPYEYTWREAALEGLTTKDNWQRMPRQMLLNRTLVRGARFVCPESTMGLYETGEMADVHDISYTLDEEGNARLQ